MKNSWKFGNNVGNEFTTRIDISGASKAFTFVACHLFPYKNNIATRLGQLEDILSQVDKDQPLIIAGDMNMRESETERVLSTFSLEDAFLLKGTKETKFTWDSKINKYHEKSHEFAARFDRVLVRGLEVSEFALIANRPSSEIKNHFLSDHYGISAELDFV